MESQETGAEVRAEVMDLLSRVIESQCAALEAVAHALEAQCAAHRIAIEPAPPVSLTEIVGAMQAIFSNLKDVHVSKDAAETEALPTTVEE